MDPLAAAVLITWKRNRAYALRLVGDLGEAEMVAQPVKGVSMNHPAWVLSHLNVYAPIAAALARGEAFEDPAEHPHGQKSSPLGDAAAYAPRGGAGLIGDYTRLHDEAQGAVEAAMEFTLRAPNPLARWRTVHPTVGDMLITLMVKHESHHLGQLSAWRRAMGKPGVPM